MTIAGQESLSRWPGARAWLAAMLLGLATNLALAADPPLPQYGADTHIGVASCAGSTCHGAIQPWKQSTVLQNEYVTWQRSDRHAKAYEVLLNERSKRIARNLGLPDAHTAAVCLDCHADNVPQDKRSRQFQISDGVGCEACHGGAVRWLGTHVSGAADHAANVAAGLYPTEDPLLRAKLCLSCHFGDDRKFVTHRIMGAGHPRMSFELDTFTNIQPAHFVPDDDYARRKKASNGVKTWAIGQAFALSTLLEAMIDPKRGRDGAFPELVLFDCQACHHSMDNLRWEARASTGVAPGIPRINDANLVILKVIAARAAPDTARELSDRGRALHKSVMEGQGPMVEAAKLLKQSVDKLVTAFAQREFGIEDMTALLPALTAEGLKGEYVDYAAAEQATMALNAVVDALKKAGMLSEAQQKNLGEAINGLYDAVAKDANYKPATFKSALQRFEGAIPQRN
jgi:Cytochrome c554 and c-prime